MKYSISILLVSLLSASALTREGFCRRDAISAAAFGVAGGFLTQVQPSLAAGTPPTKEELARITTGYKQIQALLNDFEASTTVCRENGGECKRDAEPIRELQKNRRKCSRMPLQRGSKRGDAISLWQKKNRT